MSFPRRREPSSATKKWVPAFAGKTFRAEDFFRPPWLLELVARQLELEVRFDRRELPHGGAARKLHRALGGHRVPDREVARAGRLRAVSAADRHWAPVLLDL